MKAIIKSITEKGTGKTATLELSSSQEIDFSVLDIVEIKKVASVRV